MKQLDQVKEWHEKFQVPVGYYPECLNMDRTILRHRILQEEVDELNRAMHKGDIVGVADGIADILYVAIGTAVECGLSDTLEQIFDEVHRSNMSKLDAEGNPIFREDGKVMKSKLYSPPKLFPILQGLKIKEV